MLALEKTFTCKQAGTQKRPVNFSFCKLSEKLIQWPTIFISLLESFLNYKFKFSDSKEKRFIYSRNNYIQRKRVQFCQIIFPKTFIIIWSATVNGTCMQNIKIGHRAKFRAKNKFFNRICLRFARFYAPFNFWCADFDSFRTYSADVWRLQWKPIPASLNTSWSLSLR